MEDPYYNEPAHDMTRDTDTGKSSAAEYNANLALNVGGVCGVVAMRAEQM